MFFETVCFNNGGEGGLSPLIKAWTPKGSQIKGSDEKALKLHMFQQCFHMFQ